MTAAAKITARYRRVTFGHLQVTLDEVLTPDTELLDYHCSDFAE